LITVADSAGDTDNDWQTIKAGITVLVVKAAVAAAGRQVQQCSRARLPPFLFLRGTVSNYGCGSGQLTESSGIS